MEVQSINSNRTLLIITTQKGEIKFLKSVACVSSYWNTLRKSIFDRITVGVVRKKITMNPMK